MLRSLAIWILSTVALSFGLATPASAFGLEASTTGDQEPLDANYCMENGGVDITNKGKLVLGDATSNAVICQFESGRAPLLRPSNTAAAGGLPPLTALSASFQLPSGTVSFANGQQFNTACVANLSYTASPYLPAISHGTSTFNCVGYNNGSKSLGCSVQWSGPTDVTANNSPGGQAVAAFTCIIVKLQTIQFMSSYQYVNSTYQRLNYWVQDMSSSITVTQ